MHLDTLINENYKKLNENDMHILHFIQANKKLCATLNISDLANRCNVSAASILRTTKKLNFSGYSEFKYFLKGELSKKISETPLCNPLDSLQHDISQTIKVFQQNNICELIYQKIHGAKTLYAYGTGQGQRLMLNEFARCLLNVRKNLVLLPAYTEFELASQHLEEDDLIFIVSLSGNMSSLKEVIVNLGVRHIPVVSITNLNNNELASFTKYNLYFQSSTINKSSSLNESSFLTLHLLLHLIYEGYVDYCRKIDIEK